MGATGSDDRLTATRAVPSTLDLAPLGQAFETERLRLQPLDASHVDGLWAVHGDEVVTRFLPSPTWHSGEDATVWFARHVKMHTDGRVRRWAVLDKAGDRPIGDCMLFNFDDVSRRAEVGFVLGRADWGRGAMREAVDALLRAGFGPLGLRRIEAFADPRNIASDRLLRAVGFTHEGCLRQRVVIKGETPDSNAYGLLRDEWAARGAG